MPSPANIPHNEVIMKRTGAVIFHPPAGSSEIERSVASAREASACDLIQLLHPLVSKTIVVCSSDSSRAFQAIGVSVQVVDEISSFHFGETLKQIIRDYALDALVYFGSGSGTLLSKDQLADMVGFTRREHVEALFNNYYSCDFAAFTDAATLLLLPLPEKDNGLGFLLSDHGVACYSLPRTVESQFDLDTPIDLLLLKEAARGGARLQAFLEQQHFDHPSLQQIGRLLVERTALVYLVGRVSPVTWQAFEQQVACRTAGMIEGRGMKAYADRQSPILANIFHKRGFAEFFRALENSADAALSTPGHSLRATAYFPLRRSVLPVTYSSCRSLETRFGLSLRSRQWRARSRFCLVAIR